MTNNPASDDLRRHMSADHDSSMPERQTNSPSIGWDEIAFLAEGLAVGPRVLRAATRTVTERYDLGPRGAWILDVISHGITYPVELASVFCVGRSLITSELGRLIEAGLVKVSQGKDDRRKSELSLTLLGEEESASIRVDLSAMLRRRLAGYDAREIRLTAEILRLLSCESDES